MKKIFKTTTIVLLVSLLIHIISALTLDKVVQYKYVVFESEKITEELSGYKIAFISDTHFSMQGDKLKPIVEKINDIGVDLVLFGGDFAYKGDGIDKTMEVLSKIENNDGIYGVEGNHDFYETLFAAMEKYDMVPLSNSGVRIKEGLYLAGVQDMLRNHPDIKKSLEDAKENDFTILLTHSPDVTMLQGTSAVDLVLAGHTHGGQITIFGLYAPALSINWVTAYGQRFSSGWAKTKDGTAIYISKGLGTFANIPRIFARPQVIIITLVSK